MRRHAAWAAALLLSVASIGAADAPTQPLYLDITQPVDARVADLISRLTLQEKAELLNHQGTTVQRFNIRADQWNQCLEGVKWNRPTTLFPACIAMAASWDPAMVQNVAGVLSDEARAIYNGWHLDPNAPGDHKGLIYRAPVINIERNPYWGRNHEAWGEDPFLTGRMAVAYVRGLQGDDPHYMKIAATLKHYAVNNVETNRTKLNAIVPEAMLRDYWFPHFRDAVVEGQAASVMASYNAINGTPNNINHWLLTDVLKDEWHHDGFVVSDLGGVTTMVKGHESGKMAIADAVAKSLMAGCDFSDKEFEDNIPAAIQSGALTEARLDDALTRVLRVRFKLGDFDPFDAVPFSKIPPDSIGSPDHRAMALTAEEEAIVLLENRGNLLPLDKSKLKRIAVIGPLADMVITDNYNGVPDHPVTALQGIRDAAGSAIQVEYSIGCSIPIRFTKGITSKSVSNPASPADSLAKAVDAARGADIALVFVGTDSAIEEEGTDRKSLGLPAGQEDLVKAVLAANPRTVVIQMSAGPLTVPWLASNVPAMLQAWWPGEEGGHAIAAVLFGDVNPAGRLPHTVYASESQMPPQDEYDISKGFTYMYVKGAPLYPFGYGLSYTQFAYSNLQVSPKQIPGSGSVTVSFDVQNTGQRAGDEVAQLYIHDPANAAAHPSERLRGFQRISLKPGESKSVSLEVPASRLAYWDVPSHSYIAQPGAYDVLVGASSADIRLRDQLAVTSAGSYPP
jgi:beta-glucosidase